MPARATFSRRAKPAAQLAATQQERGAGAGPSATRERPTPPAVSASASGPGGAGPSGDQEPSTNDNEDDTSLQIGLDPFSQQLILSAVTAGGAAALAAWAHLDLSNALRYDPDALAVALQLSAPAALLLLGVLAPKWGPAFMGSELERLRHNYYMTAQVLQAYDSDDEEDEPDASSASPRASSSASASAPSASAAAEGAGGREERARVRRRLRLEQSVGWGTTSSALALMQAFVLQPWNPPTDNGLFVWGVAGRSVSQLANEFLVRGAVWGLLTGWGAAALSSASTSDGILFYGRLLFGGGDSAKYMTGLALVAMAAPGALWEARNARNFVRASVVGPVRDAAIFCTGDGVNQPAYCDPAGYALLAARRPANAASVADVVTRTRGWRSGPESSFTSVSSMGSVDIASDLPPPPPSSAPSSSAGQPSSSTAAASTNGTTAASSSAATTATKTTSNNGTSATGSYTAAPTSSTASSSSSSSSNNGNGSGGDAGASLLGRVGATLSNSTAAFEYDSADMAVLLRVETLQDKIAFWSVIYFQVLTAFAINGAFLASDCNLLASFGAAWLLRTGPLLLSELRARAASAGGPVSRA